MIATFHGERMQGRYALFPTRGDDWLIHRMDPPEDPSYEPYARPARADAGAAAAQLPRDEEGWGFEVKWDGIRAVAFFDHGHMTPPGPQLHATSRRATRRCATSPASWARAG